MNTNLPYSPLYAQLVPMYNEPHRHYHNMTHINTLISRFEKIPACDLGFSLGGDGPQMMADVIWFHDCYYDPYSPGLNERMSANIYRSVVDSGTRRVSSTADAVEDIILATADHLTTHNFADRHWASSTQEVGVRVAELFMDLDLHMFAYTGLQAVDINRRIRDEYYRTSDEEFNIGRGEFLLKLLERKKIFYTDIFADQEADARHFIKGALVGLAIKTNHTDWFDHPELKDRK